MDLSEHETASQHRYEKLKHHIKEIDIMPEVKNVFETGASGAGMGLGAGLGGGLLGGILGGALLGRNGLFGNDGGVRNHVTPEQLQTAIAGLNDSTQNSMVLQSLGDIKAAVPLAESQVQTAISQATGQISNQIGQQSISLVQGFASQAQNTANAQASIIAVGETVKDSVNLTSAATQLAIANSTAQGLQNTNAIMTALRDDGDKTRALLISQNEATLQRQLAVAEAALLERNASLRARETEINITNTNTATAQQLQTQNQQMQQFQVLAQLAASVNNLCNDVQQVRQTQSNVVFGNQTGSNQNANATNNRVS